MLTVMTELDAINYMLSAIGSDPINTLVDDTDVDVDNAQRILKQVSRSIQRQGWDFNTEENCVLKPNAYDKKILWDDTIIKFSSTDGNVYSKRGSYFYDVTNKTYEFTKSITLTIIRALEFEDLPDCFRSYIAARSALAFQQRYQCDSAVVQELQSELLEAQSDIVQYDIDMSEPNALQFTRVSEGLQRS